MRMELCGKPDVSFVVGDATVCCLHVAMTQDVMVEVAQRNPFNSTHMRLLTGCLQIRSRGKHEKEHTDHALAVTMSRQIRRVIVTVRSHKVCPNKKTRTSINTFHEEQYREMPIIVIDT
jgi:hypothetical protein